MLNDSHVEFLSNELQSCWLKQWLIKIPLSIWKQYGGSRSFLQANYSGIFQFWFFFHSFPKKKRDWLTRSQKKSCLLVPNEVMIMKHCLWIVFKYLSKFTYLTNGTLWDHMVFWIWEITNLIDSLTVCTYLSLYLLNIIY